MKDHAGCLVLAKEEGRSDPGQMVQVSRQPVRMSMRLGNYGPPLYARQYHDGRQRSDRSHAVACDFGATPWTFSPAAIN